MNKGTILRIHPVLPGLIGLLLLYLGYLFSRPIPTGELLLNSYEDPLVFDDFVKEVAEFIA